MYHIMMFQNTEVKLLELSIKLDLFGQNLNDPAPSTPSLFSHRGTTRGQSPCRSTISSKLLGVVQRAIISGSSNHRLI